ncbi:MAG: hypothetical protein AAF368_16490, partial [Planctomycetota bacterium]
RVYGDNPARAILRSVAELVSAFDVTRRPIGFPDAGTLLVSWPGTDLNEAQEVAEGLIAEAKKLQPRAGGRKLPVALSIGLAHGEHSEDYGFPTLDRVAREGASVASAGGGDRCVHTELYSLLQPSAAKLTERRIKRRRSVDAPRGERDLGGLAGAPKPADEHEPIGGPFVEKDPGDPLPLRTLVVPRPIENAAPTPESAQSRALSAASTDEEARDLSLQLEGLFRGPAAHRLSPRQMQEAVIETVLTWKRNQEIARQARVHGEREEEVDQLKRRLAKISQSLADTEAELARISSAEPVETGVSSAFRTVQGLSASDPHLDAKKDMMAQLLEANLELLERIG